MCFNHELHEFSRIGSGFAGEFPCRLYSCFLAQFVDQWAVLGKSGEPRGGLGVPGEGKSRYSQTAAIRNDPKKDLSDAVKKPIGNL